MKKEKFNYKFEKYLMGEKLQLNNNEEIIYFFKAINRENNKILTKYFVEINKNDEDLLKKIEETRIDGLLFNLQQMEIEIKGDIIFITGYKYKYDEPICNLKGEEYKPKVFKKI